MLKSDDQGFLVGEAVTVDRTFILWEEIRSEMQLIRKALTGDDQRKITPRSEPLAQQNPIKKSITPSALPQQRSSGREHPSTNRRDATTVTPITRTPTATTHTKIKQNDSGEPLRNNKPAATPIGRDNKGRFTGNGNESFDRYANTSNAAEESRIAGAVAVKVAGALNEASGGLEDTDPTIKSINEIAQPMARGYELFSFNGNKEHKNNDRWFRRIFGEIKLFRKEETVFNKAANKSLKTIEQKPVSASSGNGLFSFLLIGGGLIGTIAMLAGSIIKKIPGIAFVMQSLGNVAEIFKGNVGKGTGGLAGSALGMYGGTKAGLWGGAKLGALAGAKLGAIGGPIAMAIGTALGGLLGGLGGMAGGNFVGQIIGEKVGEWTDQLKQYDIGSKVEVIWESFTTELSNKISIGWDSVTNFIKEKFGLDINDKVETAKKTVSSGIDKAKNSKAGKFVRNIFSKAGNAVESAKDWTLGQTSKLFESGNSGAGTISSGKGDFGGASYGTYQLSSNRGTLRQFLDSTEYGKQFEGLRPGTSKFNTKWKEIARSDKNFDAAQHDFIKRTHFDPQMAKLSRSGIDLSGRGRGVHDAVWSTAVQFGGNTSLIEKALAGNNTGSMSDEDIIRAIQRYKINNNETLFRSSDATTRKGTLNRAYAEKARLLSINATPSVAAATANASVPTISPAIKLPKVPDMPPIKEPLTSRQKDNKQQIVIAPSNEVGQDVKDRRIAHIVTGGFSD